MEMSSIKFNENDLNVEYVSQFIEKEPADSYLSQLRTLPFFTPTFKLRGRNVKPKRQVLAYGDPDTNYAFSGTTIPAVPWTPLMLELRDRVEKQTACAFNYVLLNFYVDGSSFISPHKDNESGLDSTFPIVVLSFGAERTITFSRPKTPPTHIKLEHGSLYIMEKPTNDLFTHGIARDPSIKAVRISLTFRRVIPLVSPSKRLKMDINDPNSSSNNGCSTLPDKQEDLKSALFADVDEWLSSALREIESKSPLQETESENPLHAEWHLNENTFVRIMLEKNSQIRIHIRTFKDTANGEKKPTKKGVVMTPITWYFFQSKLLHFKFRPNNDSFIANNQLITIPFNDECCILQQMFPLNSFGYFLKPTILKLSKEQICNLSLNYDITESIIEAKFLKLLPRLISKRKMFSCTNHISLETARQHLLNALTVEVNHCVAYCHDCQGCIDASPSQIRHSCLMEHAIFKFRSNRELVLLTVNISNIVKNLPNTCYCHYDLSFFDSFNPLANECKEIENALEEMWQM